MLEAIYPLDAKGRLDIDMLFIASYFVVSLTAVGSATGTEVAVVTAEVFFADGVEGSTSS